MATPRLPIPGSDDNQWGDILNTFLTQSHNADGTLKPSALTTAGAGTYSKPSTGIPATDLDAATQVKLNQTGGYTKPVSGIPASDLATAVQTSLSKADSALQSAPVTSVNTQTGSVTLTKSDFGLGNVDNTSDANKPISIAMQTALNAKASTSSLATVATSGSYTDLTNKPSIPTQAVSSVSGKTGVVTLASTDLTDIASLETTAHASAAYASKQRDLATAALARMGRSDGDKLALYGGASPAWTFATTSAVTGGILRAPKRLIGGAVSNQDVDVDTTRASVTRTRLL